MIMVQKTDNKIFPFSLLSLIGFHVVGVGDNSAVFSKVQISITDALKGIS